MHCETLAKRIIACLDVKAGRVVKGIQFEQIRDAGDPAELAPRTATPGADEIVLLDITATAHSRKTLLETVRRTAKQLFIPFTVGGGIRSLDDAAAVLDCGGDKVAINSAAVADPLLISRCRALRLPGCGGCHRRPTNGYHSVGSVCLGRPQADRHRRAGIGLCRLKNWARARSC